jgi:hypothetical protein
MRYSVFLFLCWLLSIVIFFFGTIPYAVTTFFYASLEKREDLAMLGSFFYCILLPILFGIPIRSAQKKGKIKKAFAYTAIPAVIGIVCLPFLIFNSNF